MKTGPKSTRFAALALAALLAANLAPAPLDTVSAGKGEPPVKCYGIFEVPVEFGGSLGSIAAPLTTPCRSFNDAIAPAGEIWPGLQLDEDGDGMGDAWEAAMDAVDLAADVDTDSDGLTNLEEFYWLSNPLEPDSDLGGGDGWNDGVEAAYWSQGQSNEGGRIPGTDYAFPGPFSYLDTDGDLIPNILDRDSDEDGLLDGEEEHHGAEARFADTDGDGLIDGGITIDGQRIIGEVHDVGSLPDRTDSEGSPTTGTPEPYLEDDFDDGLLDTESWSYSGVKESDECDATSNPNALYFYGTGTRSITTKNLDARNGGTIQFTVRHGTTTGGGVCDRPEADTNDDLVLEYSLNDGSSWTTIQTYAAGDYGSWSSQSALIPVGAQSASTLFRWYNLNHAASTTRDHWAIDDVVLNRPVADDGDGLDDLEEYHYWLNQGYQGTKTLDTDGDGIINILDLDSDGDGALDGDEVQAGTEADDPDTDNDRLPDGWELRFNHQPRVNDAGQDLDSDGATALEEYCYGLTSTACRTWDYYGKQDYYRGGTIPNDADTEDDLVLDGEEFDAGTDPHHWDTDRDGMPDEFELQHSLDPLDASDATEDADQDFFDQDQDGIPEQTHNNLAEYRYGRPAGHNEAKDGPWQLGTDPNDPDTDDDGSNDAQEIYYGTNPRVGTDGARDDDQDGLNWTAEARRGTDPNDHDTDGDGLCDGGRATACTHPSVPGVGHPGEADYGSTPWMTDSDQDGLPDGVEATIWDAEASGKDADVDADGLGGILDADSDDDDLLDGDESGWGTRMDISDSDADGLEDGAEVYLHGTTPNNQDTDGDGLLDGLEVQVHYTDPLHTDTDADGLTDGAEVQTHGTNPLAKDSDADGMPDAWEVAEGTRPAAPDADVDVDGDGLNNLVEYQFDSSPILADTDLDTLPDGWEYEYDLDPRTASQNIDSDSDGSLNGAEYRAGTSPRNPDSDGDGLSDGDEAREGTLPLVVDSDADGLLDGEEVHTYNTEPLERDTDADGLSDYDEVVSTNTKPLDPDSDNDGLSDYEEVFLYQGIYDPNNPDTDGDGQDDGLEVALSDPEGDVDRDGLTNGQEYDTYGTDPEEADSDCDGIQDAAEVAYWKGKEYALSTYKAYLWNADVDGDGIKDGVEAGYAGTPQQALYRTEPDMKDSDDDGLDDNEEARNNVRVSCSQAQTRSSTRLPEPVPGFSLADASRDASSLVPGALYEDPEGVFFGIDEEGIYIQGGYGVRLYVLDQAVDSTQLLEPVAMNTAAGTNGKLTDPQLRDTDGDGLLDGQEVNLLGTNPNVCDSDGDGLGDALELRVAGRTLNPNNPCTHLDSDPLTGSDPLNDDSDGDGRLDGVEDANANGRADWVLDAIGYCGRAGSETSPGDLDSDDDGISDLDEINGILSGGRATLPFCFDSDGDGLSDGLEVGLKAADKTPDTVTRSMNVYGRIVKTWQPSATGLQLNPNVFDFDSDGIPDGLEDLDADGRWGLSEGEMDPSKADTDGDKVVDGRELLMWGLGNYQVPFAAVMKQWGGSIAGASFDAGNPFETDPLASNTDAGLVQEGNVPDGLDLNPRGDAFFAIDFGKIKMNERPDHNDWWAEIYVSKLDIDLPFTEGGYSVGLSDATAVGVYTKSWTDFPPTLVGKIKNPPTRPSSIASEGFWTMEKVTGESILKVNLPDSGASLNPADQTIAIDLWLMEDDRWSPDDVIDLNPKSGSNAHQEFRLGEIIGDAGISGEEYLGLQRYYKDHAANDDKTSRDEDGALKLRLGDNVHEFFLQTVTDVLKTNSAGVPNVGTCFSEAGCI